MFFPKENDTSPPQLCQATMSFAATAQLFAPGIWAKKPCFFSLYVFVFSSFIFFLTLKIFNVQRHEIDLEIMWSLEGLKSTSR